tara:strand:+ start:847 stop:1452 length:606 start_codon:yes stop_codon:yes gene_type:complete
VDHDGRRREIADAILRVIADQGVAGATFRVVAEASKWSTGVLSHYFRNRDDMLLEALRRAGELAGDAQKGIGASMRGRDAVLAILEEELPLDSRRIALTRIFVFFYAEAVADPAVLAEIDGYLERWRRQTEIALRAAQHEGDVDADIDPRTVAAQLVALTDGLSIHAIFNERLLAQLREGNVLRPVIERLAAPASDRAAPR